MGFDLPEDKDFDTIGGFVFAEFGRVPTGRRSDHLERLGARESPRRSPPQSESRPPRARPQEAAEVA